MQSVREGNGTQRGDILVPRKGGLPEPIPLPRKALKTRHRLKPEDSTPNQNPPYRVCACVSFDGPAARFNRPRPSALVTPLYPAPSPTPHLPLTTFLRLTLPTSSAYTHLTFLMTHHKPSQRVKETSLHLSVPEAASGI